MSELLSGRSGEAISKIAAFIEQNGSITNAQGQEITEKSAPQVRRYLNQLEAAGYIQGSQGTRNKVYTKKIRSLEMSELTYQMSELFVRSKI